MKIVGLTGGIGSGKTTVANLFKELGVPVYIADNEAKKLMAKSKIIKRHLIQLLGNNAYIGNDIDRAFIAKKIFVDSELLSKVNHIVHPKVAAHFKRWVSKQAGPYCIKEGAILFETGSYKDCDATILITAPNGVRLKRVLARDAVSEEDVLNRMDNQWSDKKKKKLADIVIENLDLSAIKIEVLKVHLKLSKSS
ncbi:MAG: dephospho-CoA kinase [Candidatus Latescibacterota bacterium]